MSDYRTTDIFGNPVKPSTLLRKRTSTQKAQRLAATPTPKVNPQKRAPSLPIAITQRPDQSEYLRAAKEGKFKMQGLEQHWTASRLPWAIHAGPTRSDRQQSLQRVIEGELMDRVGQDVRSASAMHVASPVSPARRLNDSPSPDADTLLMRLHLRGQVQRNPDASVPTLLHAEDPAYVDIYRNYLQDREDRIDFKQKKAYIEHDKFVVNPETKLQTLKAQREEFKRSLKPRIVNPAEVPEQFMPLAMQGTRRSRRTIEHGEEADTTAVARQTFTEELRRLCAAKPPGFFEGAGVQGANGTGAAHDNRFVKEVLSGSSRGLPPLGESAIESPTRLRDSWATMDRAKAYPYQKQVAMQRHIQEEAMIKAVAPLVQTKAAGA